MTRLNRSALVLAAILAVAFGGQALAQSPPSPSGTSEPQPAQAPPAPSSDGHTQLFQVAMVIAGNAPNADLDGDGKRDSGLSSTFKGFPQSVRKALEDLGDFLPYKSYKLLDTALIRTSRRGIANLRGPGGREFRVEMRYRPKASDRETDLVINGFEVLDMTRTPGRSHEFKDSGGITQKQDIPPSGPKAIISTSFGMSLGETLVVGSSRLNGGNTALIMLVTAAR